MYAKILEGGKIMISCNEFIPLYNELFKFIDKNFSKKDNVKLWEDISKGSYVNKLDNMVREKGLQGIYEYWKEILSEEGGRYELTLRDNEFVLDMHYCPSVGKLTSTHIEPYNDYCGHCAVLYIRIYEKYGLKGARYIIDRNKGQCREYVWKE